MTFTELVGSQAWPWVAAVLYLTGAGVNVAAVFVLGNNPRAWVRWSNAIFGAVIGGHWVWLATHPDLNRGTWSEGLTPWSTFAGIMGVGCLGAVHDLLLWRDIKQKRSD